MTLTLPSFAKINRTLEILGRRPDGYHELRTILQTVDLADTLRFTPIDRGIEIVCDHPEVPLDERNLVWRAARLLNEYVGADYGIRVEIEKRIPAAGGLGGGSSNAAITLLALRHLWQIEVPLRKLFAMASRLGADVPFFLVGGSCLGVGRGDEVYPITDPQGRLETPYILLVNRGILVPTRDVYASLPAELTKPLSGAMMPLCLEVLFVHVSGHLPGSKIASSNADITSVQRLHNDLEIPVLPRYPQLREVREKLLELGAVGALLSGSGSTVFAVFENDPARQNAATLLRHDGWQAFPVATVGLERYQRLLGEVSLF